MKKIISWLIILTFIHSSGINAQILSTSNKPSQIYSSSGKGIVAGPEVYGVFVGRTPCQEFLQILNMEASPACTKRKMAVTLYQNSNTHEPTEYETRGMGKWSGKGKWQIVRGIPSDPKATVYQLNLGPAIFLYLLKGDDNVLFILDKNKNYIPGNADHSYTLNRARN